MLGTVGTGEAGASVTGDGKGVYSFLPKGHALTEVGVIEAKNAGIICTSPDGRHIYAANETRDFDGGLPGSGGGVTALAVADGGTLREGRGIALLWLVPLKRGRERRRAAPPRRQPRLLLRHRLPLRRGRAWRLELERDFDDASLACFSLTGDGDIGNLCDLKVRNGSDYWNQGGGQS